MLRATTGKGADMPSEVKAACDGFLDRAREGCIGCGLLNTDERVPTEWAKRHCLRRDEHDRTAALLRQQDATSRREERTRVLEEAVKLLRDRAAIVAKEGDDWDITGQDAAEECADEISVLANMVEALTASSGEEQPDAD